MRRDQKRALFLIGDDVVLYPPDSASAPDIELRGLRTKIKAVQFGSDPEYQLKRNPTPGETVGFLAEDLWSYRLNLEGNLGTRRFREDWLRPG